MADASHNQFFTRLYNQEYSFDFDKPTLCATPLLLCLIAIEVTDVMFSFDSVPAVIAITKDPVLVYAAMIFAILGLRSLYFVLEALQQYLIHLSLAVTFVLFFISFKLIAHATIGLDVNPMVSLGIIVFILATGVLTSVIHPKGE